jgi:hypothetical protein
MITPAWIIATLSSPVLNSAVLRQQNLGGPGPVRRLKLNPILSAKKSEVPCPAGAGSFVVEMKLDKSRTTKQKKHNENKHDFSLRNVAPGRRRMP